MRGKSINIPETFKYSKAKAQYPDTISVARLLLGLNRFLWMYIADIVLFCMFMVLKVL